jgi:hypothetical protein
VQIDEAELLKRLKARGGDWVGLYKNYYHETVVPPYKGEFDDIIIYNQINLADVIERLDEFTNS